MANCLLRRRPHICDCIGHDMKVLNDGSNTCTKCLRFSTCGEESTHTLQTTTGSTATCKTEGTTKQKCVNDGCTYTKTITGSIDPNNHEGDYSRISFTNSTCRNYASNTYSYDCCGYTFITYGTEYDSNNHEGILNEISRTTATCTQDGEIIYEYSCCGATDIVSIPKTDHTEETVVGYAATCTETGLTDGVKCAVCGEVLVAQEEIEKLDHVYDDLKPIWTQTFKGNEVQGCKWQLSYKCTNCSEEYIEGSNYPGGTQVVTQNPTCTTGGFYHCSPNGGYTYCTESHIIAPTGHTHTNYYQSSLEGHKFVCDICGEAYGDLIEHDGNPCTVCGFTNPFNS